MRWYERSGAQGAGRGRAWLDGFSLDLWRLMFRGLRAEHRRTACINLVIAYRRQAGSHRAQPVLHRTPRSNWPWMTTSLHSAAHWHRADALRMSPTSRLI